MPPNIADMNRADAAAAAAAKVSARGGIVRSNDLVRQGTAKWAIADAVSLGKLVRLRRVWVATPQADRELTFAAKGGVLLSCVTQARRLGPWVLDNGMPHVAAHPHAGGVNLPNAVVHRARALVPRPPGALVDPIENVLHIVAGCLPDEQALMIWDSAMNKRMVDRDVLLRLPLSAAARDLCERADPFSDSGLETVVPQRLKWLGLRILRQAWILGRRVDFLIGERLVLQIDGGHHVGPQRAADNAHDAALMLRGYHVIRIGYHDVIDDWPRVQELIMRAVAQGLHKAA